MRKRATEDEPDRFDKPNKREIFLTSSLPPFQNAPEVPESAAYVHRFGS
jgi:hypothetical protein